MIDLDPLIAAVERLICDIGQMADSANTDAADQSLDGKAAPERLDKMARAISAQLKAMADIQTHNERAAQTDEDKKYLRYEDLPPPSPADRARFTQRFIDLVGQIETSKPCADDSEDDPSE